MTGQGNRASVRTRAEVSWPSWIEGTKKKKKKKNLGDKPRAAADVYDQQGHEAGGALDRSVRYDCFTRSAQRNITMRCTTKLMTVAVPWAITKATGTRQGFSSHSV